MILKNLYTNKLLTLSISLFCLSLAIQSNNSLNFNIALSAKLHQKIINKNTRVLHIGDSHTAGFYGKEMDRLLRETGAKVRTYGSSGSSPASWFNGFVTKSGFYYKDENEKDEIPQDWKMITPEFELELAEGIKKDWQTPTKTPNIKDIILEFKPNVIIFSLGANLMYSPDLEIEKQVREMCEVAKSSKAKIIWVGPPDGRIDKKTPEQQERLYNHIQKIVVEYGIFIDSRPYTDYPEYWTAPRFDGVHFFGEEGEIMADEWANQIFSIIQSI